MIGFYQFVHGLSSGSIFGFCLSIVSCYVFVFVFPASEWCGFMRIINTYFYLLVISLSLWCKIVKFTWNISGCICTWKSLCKTGVILLLLYARCMTSGTSTWNSFVRNIFFSYGHFIYDMQDSWDFLRFLFVKLCFFRIFSFV